MEFVAQQINGDQDVNVDMEGVEKIEDFEFLDFDLSDVQNDSWVDPGDEEGKREESDEEDAE